MSGCEIYQIKPLERFESSFKKVVKNRYRKNARARNAFNELISTLIDNELRKNPSSDAISQSEPFPKKCHDPNYQFRKIKFSMPELNGLAGCGRLMEEHIQQDDGSIENKSYPSDYVCHSVERVLPNADNLDDFKEAELIAEGNQVAEIWKAYCVIDPLQKDSRHELAA